MNKFLNITKVFLFILLVILNSIYLSNFGLSSGIYIFYLLLLLIFGLLMFKDLIQKNKINNDKMFNLIFIFIELIMIFVFIRAIFDQHFIYNSDYYMNLINEYNNGEFMIMSPSDVESINMFYIIQSSWYLIIMLLLILTYRKINMEKKESKYSMISLTCFYISICTIIPTISYISSTKDNVLLFLVLNIVLVGTEIYRLINDNHRKREWIIYVSFFFNLAAFIAIFINMFY